MRRLIFILSILLYYGCTPSRIVLLAPDRQQKITVFEWSDQYNEAYVIITLGDYQKDRLPRSYLKIRKKWRDGWQCLIKWEYDRIIIFEPYNLFEEHNL
ncbi:MAG: hypothetical protein AAF705_06100, partial [Bacteroidota bacterium]